MLNNTTDSWLINLDDEAVMKHAVAYAGNIDERTIASLKKANDIAEWLWKHTDEATRIAFNKALATLGCK